MEQNFNSRLYAIQQELKCKKAQYNNFGKYLYRSCEDVLEAVKPILNGLTLTISDDIIQVGDRIYIKATAKLSDGENHLECSGLAREAENQKGMSDSQLTGSASSYARKYALNGLFCIDDTKDDDTRNPNDIAPQTITQSQFQELQELISTSTKSTEDICNAFKLGSLIQLPQNKFNSVKARLEQCQK